MIKKLFAAVLILFFLSAPPSLHAQERQLPPEVIEEYFHAKVETVSSKQITVRILKGTEKGEKITLANEFAPQSAQLKTGDSVIVLKSTVSNKTQYLIVDKYRLDTTLYILLAFFILVICIAGKKGIGSIVGMIVSVAIILQFIVPQILQGRDPLFISIAGSLFTMAITLYLAHGFNRRTTISLVSTSLSLLVAGIFAYVTVAVTQLSGLGSEEAGFLLQLGSSHINMQGLLLGSIIIGALGVLDDITTSQTAAVFEIHAANKNLSFTDLLVRGYRIGKEHIASLVNTLVLAYAGASLSLFILFSLNPAHQPYWVLLNNQSIIEELVRTIAGSTALVLAVPISTACAAWAAIKYSRK